MDSTLTLGEYLRHLRRRKGWNLQQLAHNSGLSVSHLSRLENDNGLPNAQTVVNLSTALEGDLEQMLQLADCLPEEILDRLLRRVGSGASQHRRSAGAESDPGFARAFVEDIDPALRTGLARQFGLTENDVDGVYAALQAMAQMEPAQRDATVQFLVSFTRENRE